LAVEKGIVHIMDDGMSSIQECLLDDRREAKPYSSFKLGLTSYVEIKVEVMKLNAFLDRSEILLRKKIYILNEVLK
jgi:hypothetical protein